MAGLLLAGAAGAAWGQRRKRRVVLPAKPEETVPRVQESVEHAALREILEHSVAYNDDLYGRVQALETLESAAERTAAVTHLAEENKEERRKIDSLRVALQAHLDSKGMRFCDVDGFVELLSHFRRVTLEQQEKHLEMYRRVCRLAGVSDSAELHAYLKLGFSDAAQKQADSAGQMQRAMEEQREIMLRVGRMLAGIKDAASAAPAPEELLRVSARYQELTRIMHLYRNDDPEGVAESLAALKAMYAALTPPLKERASLLRSAECYGHPQLREILDRLLPEK